MLKNKSLLGFSLVLICGICHAAIPPTERAVLLNLYAYTQGQHWANSMGWNGPSGTECSWYGITCDPAGNTVIKIALVGNNLNGSLPPLAGLTNLQLFDIRQVPECEVDCFNNRIVGSIPDLSGLTKLQYFLADNTWISGNIPSLTGLANLVQFKVSNCRLSGNIPSLGGLTQLTDFDVHNNQLSGGIPPLTGLTGLINFDVDQNYLVGSIPDITGLLNLKTFYVSGNFLTGNVPELTNLPNLSEYAVGGNLLNGNIGGFSELPNLSVFDATSNLLTGNIPSFSNVMKLQQFYVGGNHLSGNIPDISTLADLQDFVAVYNQLTGSAPAPPSSLKAGALCPNMLTPASTPPSSIDIAWNNATGVTPWSQHCSPNPKWMTNLVDYANPNPSFVGQSVTYTAVVWGMNPAGTVTFTSEPDAPGGAAQVATLCANVPLVNSVATCTVNNFAAGSWTIVAAYSGDAQNETSTDYTGTIFGNVPISDVDQVVQFSLDLTSTASAAQIGQPVDLAGSLAGIGATSTLTFNDGDTSLCSGVPVYATGSTLVGHCVTQFATAGPHSITVSADDQEWGAPPIPLIENVTATAPFDADQFALTGSWYNPPTSGQGLELEVYPDIFGAGSGYVFGGWFTYDAAGHPQWVTVQGTLAASHGAVYTLTIAQNTGGNFDAGPITQAVADGTATLTFYDCSHAALTYQFNDGRSGTIPYVRLTPATACSAQVPAVAVSPPPANYADVLHSGAWYEPATSGQGLMIDIAPSINTFFAAWYTYAPQTEGQTGAAAQRWFTLQDNTYTPGDLHLKDVPIIATSGGVFNQPSNVSVGQVGTAQIDFTSCTTMTLSYAFTQGEFAGLSGTINENVIVPLAGCQ